MSEKDEVLIILAKLNGAYLTIDMYDHPAVKKSNRLSHEEVLSSLKILVSEGLVASIFERLDGPLYALSEKGRQIMVQRGFEFDLAKIEKTRSLFSAYLCKTPI
jgi:hypothetical protein